MSTQRRETSRPLRERAPETKEKSNTFTFWYDLGDGSAVFLAARPVSIRFGGVPSSSGGRSSEQQWWMLIDDLANSRRREIKMNCMSSVSATTVILVQGVTS